MKGRRDEAEWKKNKEVGKMEELNKERRVRCWELALAFFQSMGHLSPQGVPPPPPPDSNSQ
jgi:hypothetical protein